MLGPSTRWGDANAKLLEFLRNPQSNIRIIIVFYSIKPLQKLKRTVHFSCFSLDTLSTGRCTQCVVYVYIVWLLVIYHKSGLSKNQTNPVLRFYNPEIYVSIFKC